MTTQITIIGLGQIGTSFGLALAQNSKQVFITGHDIQLETARKALQLGAIHKVEPNLPASVRNADLIILAMPLKGVIQTLDFIIPDLRENVVIMDTAPIKNGVANWVKQKLPEARYYVGLVPAINPAYIHDTVSGQDAAHADLFDKGLMGIVALPNTPGDAIKLASDLTQLLGATPMFIDLAESDGLMSSIHLLPQLMAAAITNAIIDRPGWLEMRKLAARPFASSTYLATENDLRDGLHTAVIANRENTLRVLNYYIEELQSIRTMIDDGNEEQISDYFEQAFVGRRKWFIERERGDWLTPELGEPQKGPSLGDIFKHMFIGERPKKK